MKENNAYPPTVGTSQRLPLFCLSLSLVSSRMSSSSSFFLPRRRFMKGGTSVVSSKLCSLQQRNVFFSCSLPACLIFLPLSNRNILEGGERNEKHVDLEDERLQHTTECFCVDKIQLGSIQYSFRCSLISGAFLMQMVSDLKSSEISIDDDLRK